jgi:MEMO1 family protein
LPRLPWVNIHAPISGNPHARCRSISRTGGSIEGLKPLTFGAPGESIGPMNALTLTSLSLWLALLGEPSTEIRKPADPVGFCWSAPAIEAVMREASTEERGPWKKTREIAARKNILLAIAPHDDHLLSARVGLHAILPAIAGARTVLIFGVTHKPARQALKDPRGLLLLEDFPRWSGPYGPVAVDEALRAFLGKRLPAERVRVSREAHALEHSVESLVPLLQSRNRALRILPLMVTEVDLEGMESVSGALAEALGAYLKENKLALGKDLAFLISSDAVHYGPDFSYQPFGLDEPAHQKAMEQDRAIAQDFLSGPVTQEKLRGFANKVWKESIPWCGRFSIPVGLLTVQKLAASLGKRLEGIPVRQGDSYTLGALPLGGLGIGTTAPFSLQHFVGYWSILYALE